MRKSSLRAWSLDLGARAAGGRVAFKVWGPRVARMELKYIEGRHSKQVPMERDEQGYHTAEIERPQGELRYFYVLDGKRERPDPCSRFQPEGVHKPSALVDPSRFRWSDASWKGIPPADYLFYELHIGTFTREGTFEAAASKIPYLKKLGVTCVEIMPVSQFPGARNWGYDGVHPFAPQNTYGGPDGLKKLVNACHRAGLAVCLDVVYNHLGPEGNYLSEFGPYFTDRYQTPWGSALNFDGPDSDEVRRFVCDNARYWIAEYHVDALRLDAVHGIFDFGAVHILEELGDAAHELGKALGRKVAVVAESDLNDPRVVRPKESRGHGLDAQWSDDFHHALHARLTGERQHYYRDFGSVEDLAKSLRDVFVYDGRYSVFRRRRHGAPAAGLGGERFVIHTQNHDQVGNRAAGDRLSSALDFESEKLAAALMLFAPFLPLLWMGQEYGETAPFQYFIDHGDAALVQAVRQGRKNEFGAADWNHVPDPKDEATYLRSKLDWKKLGEPRYAALFEWYRRLIALRRRLRIPQKLGRDRWRVFSGDDWIGVRYDAKPGAYGAFYNFSKRAKDFDLRSLGARRWSPLLSSRSREFGGPDAAPSACRGTLHLSGTGAAFGRLQG